MSTDRECRLDIGGTILSLECPSAEYATSMREYFGVGAGPAGEPHLALALELVDHEEWPQIPDSLYNTKEAGSDGFAIGGDLVRGSYDAATGRGTVQVKYALTKAHLTRVFEQLLYQAWESARRRAGQDAFLVHSSGVIRGGDGFLFVGAPGAGKSTVATLSAGRHVVNDEICLVAFADDGVELHGTPFNGHVPDKKPGRAPLRAVCLLEQGPEHALAAAGRAAGAAVLAGQIVPPMGLDEALTGAVRGEMLVLADRLGAAAPVQRLTFLPDDGFWQAIDAAFPPSTDANPRGDR